MSKSTLLTSCVECGKSISEDASLCPHCKRYPKFRDCRICKGSLKESDALKIEEHDERWVFVHQNCLENILSETYKCPACGKEFNYRHPDHPHLRKYPLPIVRTCPECGHNIESLECNNCRFSVARL